MKKVNLQVEGKPLSLDFSDHFAYLAKINEALNLGVAEHYKKSGLTYVDVPAIVGITGACENVDTLFKVQNRLDIPLFFTQTGQLALEQALQSFPGVYTVIHSGRDEEEEDERHLRQFRLTEEEFDCTLVGMTRTNYDEEKMFENLLAHIQKAVQAMIKKILIEQGDVLKHVYKRDIKKIELATQRNFLQIEYAEAIKLLNKEGYKNLSFGDDLTAEHEAKIIKLVNNGTQLPVFITKYPKEIKFFNMKVYTKNPQVVLSADLIFPYAGEGTGSAVREHDFEKLNERLLTSNMYRLHIARGGRYEDFAWYLNIIKNQLTSPHAGYGIGNERVLQYVLGEKDIRNASLFSLLNRQTRDWENTQYGRASIISSSKKHFLISCGKADKKRLLPHIKTLALQNDFVLYATKKTHLFLRKNNIKTVLVYKISEIGKNPNIADLLGRRVFDLIINIPTHKNLKKSKEITDGKIIRKAAKELGITLITNVKSAKDVIDNLSLQPFYNPKKTYQENYELGPFTAYNKKFIDKDQPRFDFLGYKVHLPFGIAAGPLLNSRFVKFAFESGFDIAVYKTVRTQYFPVHPYPNILPVKVNGRRLTLNQLAQGLKTDVIYGKKPTITNSFGVPSKEPQVWQEDVKKALNFEGKGKLLILSFMGTAKKNQKEKEFIDDYVLAAKLAKETGVKVLEVNLSCPNLGGHGLVCEDLVITEKIVKGIRKVIDNTPLILKIGYLPQDKQLKSLAAIASGYADAISAVNALPSRILDKFDNQALPGKTRLISGVCGAGIKWAGLEMVKRLKKIKEKHRYSFKIIGVGGVFTPKDYFDYQQAGSDCVMSATGAMWNPLLAWQIKKLM